jgi:hypothetical protein
VLDCACCSLFALAAIHSSILELGQLWDTSQPAPSAGVASHAPPFHAVAGLSTHAAQRLVSLFHLLARRYSRLQAAADGTPSALLSPSLDSPQVPWTPADAPQAPAGVAAPPPAAAAAEAAQQQQQQQQQEQLQREESGQAGQEAASEAQELELQLYADFLRIVLEVRSGTMRSRRGRAAAVTIQSGQPGGPSLHTPAPSYSAVSARVRCLCRHTRFPSSPRLSPATATDHQLHPHQRPAPEPRAGLHAAPPAGTPACRSAAPSAPAGAMQAAQGLPHHPAAGRPAMAGVQASGSAARVFQLARSGARSKHPYSTTAFHPCPCRRCLPPLPPTLATRSSWRTSGVSPTSSTAGWRRAWWRAAQASCRWNGARDPGGGGGRLGALCQLSEFSRGACCSGGAMPWLMLGLLSAVCAALPGSAAHALRRLAAPPAGCWT